MPPEFSPASLPRLPLAALTLLGAFCLLGGLWFWFETHWDRRLFTPKAGHTCRNVDAASAKAWLEQHPETQILDVRSAREFQDGALPGALNLPLGAPHFDDQLRSWEKTRPVLVYCAGGYRSRKAVERLQHLGFTEIHHLHRGYLSWKWSQRSAPKSSSPR